MISISEKLNIDIQNKLPESYMILKTANLIAHPAVYAVILTGSRGLNNSFRPDSDMDLSLLVDSKVLSESYKKDVLLRNILETTFKYWKGLVELDAAAVFDIKNCGLKCFHFDIFKNNDCLKIENDCFGLFKIQKGFNGFVPKIGVQIQKAYPVITIWERKKND